MQTVMYYFRTWNWLISYRHSSSCSCSYQGDALQKSLRLCHFKSGLDEIWQDCSSSKYAKSDRVISDMAS